MFSKNDEGKIVLDVRKTKYVIDNYSDYKKLVILLTDPLATDQDLITVEDLEIDLTLEEEDRRLCGKYREFINKFEENRKDIIENIKEEATA
jgi:hypothetical protein